MERLSDKARGYALIKAVGVEPTRLVDSAAAQGLDFWGVYPEDDYTLVFRTRLNHAEAILSFADKCCCEAKIIEKRGAPIEAKKLRRRYVLWALPVIFLALLVTSSFFIWEIDITGNETVSKIQILNALEDSGVYIGSYSPNFTSDNIRSRVLIRIPELKWISVSVFGSRAVVEVRERTEIPELYDEDEPVKIVAKQSGIIEQINVLRGFSLFKKGQTAAESETLIDGAVPSTFSETEIVHAEGSVIARTWYEISAVMSLQSKEKTYTGQEKSCFALIVGNKRINFYGKSRIFDMKCDNIVSKKTLGVKGFFQLPITLVSEKAVFYELTVADVSKEDARVGLETRLNDELKYKIGESGQIVSSEYNFSVIDGFAVGTLRAECIQNIAAEKEMTAEEIILARKAKEEEEPHD
ncbi:MAG: sporulation protein YqfD [Oscillospiraceae bacterium]|nr:sporulation protein YqfD [Oscillospiraceae bacterium]